MLEKPMPSNIEAERALIGATLMLGRKAANVYSELTPLDFYDTKHQEIVAVIQSILAQQLTPDIVTVSDRVKKQQPRGLPFIPGGRSPP